MDSIWSGGKALHWLPGEQRFKLVPLYQAF